MSEFIEFINHERSPEAYIATMFTILIVNLIILSIVFKKLFHLNIFVSIFLAYIISVSTVQRIIQIKSKIIMPYLTIDYFIRNIPLLGEIIYSIGGLLFMPYLHIMNEGQTSFFYIL
jgi:hypothetical protein